MIDPLDNRYRPFLLFLKRKRRGTFLVLTLENIIHHTWRPVFWCLLFAGLWMLALPAFLGIVASVLTLIVFIAGLTFLIRKDTLAFQLPDKKNVDKRMEAHSPLGQGHIALIEDQLANPNIITTRLLWHKAQRDGLFKLKKLRVPFPQPRLSEQDPYALRFIILLIFAAGLLFAGHNWKERLQNGLVPITPSFTLAKKQNTDLWIKPPDYTQLPQIHLSGTGHYKDTLNIPEVSTYHIRMRSPLGCIFSPHLRMGENNIQLTYMEDGLYGAEGIITPGTKISITQALLPRASWPYNYIVDTPPEISSDTGNKETQIAVAEGEGQIQEEGNDEEIVTDDTTSVLPSAYDLLDNGQIRFPLIVKDDYGVKNLHMTMSLDEEMIAQKDAPLGQDAQETRLIMSQPDNAFKIAPVYDMTWHSWAGLPVTFEFTATDHKGQSTTLDKIKVVIPEREFKHPMAKALIAMRKELAWHYKTSFEDIASNIETLLSAPDYFQNNLVIFLSIRTASSRLYHNDDKPEQQRLKAAYDVINLLWITALSIEDGNVSIALRELREAQRVLENAMRDPNVNNQEIQDLMENLRKKMANYFTELRRDMQKRMVQGEDMPLMSPEDFGTLITPNTLAEIMAQIEQAMRDGNKQKTQELMSQLQRMMEMIDPSKTALLPNDMQMMRQGVNELQQLIQRQEELIKQTEEHAEKQSQIESLNGNDLQDENLTQDKQIPSSITHSDLPSLEQMLKDFGIDSVPPAPKPQTTRQSRSSSDIAENTVEQLQIDTSENKVEQEALRYILGQLMMEAAEKLDKVPENMGKAEQEMRGSSQELGENHPIQSLPYQNNAVDYLKEAQKSLTKQFRQRMQQMVGIAMSGSNQKYDPLGRPYGQDPDSEIKIPDETQKKQVDNIIRQLRQRSGDRSRSREELEYYRRLLRQF